MPVNVNRPLNVKISIAQRAITGLRGRRLFTINGRSALTGARATSPFEDAQVIGRGRTQRCAENDPVQ